LLTDLEHIVETSIFKKWDEGAWIGLSWLRIRTGSVSCECGSEPPGSIKCGEFLD
jgi:hypothetical protein